LNFEALLPADQLSIARLVPHGSRVFDLGCTGALLAYLIQGAWLQRLRRGN
jgi:hypothetical protein